jgi:hypothetical protein
MFLTPLGCLSGWDPMARQVTLEGSPKNRRWAAATRKIYGKSWYPLVMTNIAMV